MRLERIQTGRLIHTRVLCFREFLGFRKAHLNAGAHLNSGDLRSLEGELKWGSKGDAIMLPFPLKRKAAKNKQPIGKCLVKNIFTKRPLWLEKLNNNDFSLNI